MENWLGAGVSILIAFQDPTDKVGDYLSVLLLSVPAMRGRNNDNQALMMNEHVWFIYHDQ